MNLGLLSLINSLSCQEICRADCTFGGSPGCIDSCRGLEGQSRSLNSQRSLPQVWGDQKLRWYLCRLQNRDSWSLSITVTFARVNNLDFLGGKTNIITALWISQRSPILHQSEHIIPECCCLKYGSQTRALTLPGNDKAGICWGPTTYHYAQDIHIDTSTHEHIYTHMGEKCTEQYYYKAQDHRGGMMSPIPSVKQ